QVQVVPSAARTTTPAPLTAVIVPRSNASVRGPFFVSKVYWPYIPPRRRSRTSARRSRRSATRSALLSGPEVPDATDEASDASASAPFSTAACPVAPAAGSGAVRTAAVAAGALGPEAASVTANAPPARTAHVTIRAAARLRGDQRRGRPGPGPGSTRSFEYMLVMLASIGLVARDRMGD